MIPPPFCVRYLHSLVTGSDVGLKGDADSPPRQIADLGRDGQTWYRTHNHTNCPYYPTAPDRVPRRSGVP
jgi:hypothetical protein